MQKTICWLCLTALLSSPVLAQNPILFNGGISEEERATAPTTGTRLVFFVRAGNYLADVRVTVRAADGREVVSTVTSGPWLILDLPPGRYQVVAALENGETHSLAIDVDGQPREFGFMFSSVE